MNQYRRGARVEYEIRDHLGERGYDVVRAAGSKGKIDLVAFNDDELCFVQVKITAGLTSPAERRELLRQAKRAGAYPLVAYKEREGRRSIVRFRELTGPGPREYEEWIPMATEPEPQHDPSSGGTDQGPDDPDHRAQDDHSKPHPSS